MAAGELADDMAVFAERVCQDRRRKLVGPEFTKFMVQVAPWPRIWGWLERLQVSPEEYERQTKAETAWEALRATAHDPIIVTLAYEPPKRGAPRKQR